MNRFVQFSEIQHQSWILRLAFAGVGVLIFSLFFRQVIQGIPVGHQPVTNLVMTLIWLGIGIVLPLLFISSRLEISVNQDVLQYRYFPFHLTPRSIPLSRISEAKAIQYRPLRDYGGWGIRAGRYGMGYTISGSWGVRIAPRDGKPVFLGSHQPQELVQALKAGNWNQN